MGGAWTLDRLWERLGIAAAIRRVAAGRRLDAEVVERVVFALVAQRALEPGSKLAATGWVAEVCPCTLAFLCTHRCTGHLQRWHRRGFGSTAGSWARDSFCIRACREEPVSTRCRTRAGWRCHTEDSLAREGGGREPSAQVDLPAA